MQHLVFYLFLQIQDMVAIRHHASNSDQVGDSFSQPFLLGDHLYTYEDEVIKHF